MLKNMNKAIRHFVAIFLMLWLPVFSGSASAMVACAHMMSQDMSRDVSMTATDQGGPCNMQDTDRMEKTSAGCDQCGQCHVACSPGITSTSHTPVTIASNVEHASPLQLFHSITLPLLDPPPLVLL